MVVVFRNTLLFVAQILVLTGIRPSNTVTPPVMQYRGKLFPRMMFSKKSELIAWVASKQISLPVGGQIEAKL